MNVNDMFPTRFLKASDVPEEGDLVLTINNVGREELGQGEDAEQKPVVWFSDHDKGLVLNKVNANTIAELYGPDTKDWEDQKIALFATEVEFKGKQVLALRVRKRKPRAAKPEPVAAGAGKPAKPELWDDEDQ